MKLHLRTVIYARKVTITKVPIYECKKCGTSEVYSGVKKDIGRLLGELGAQPSARTISFDQMNEWVAVLTAALSKSGDNLQASYIAKAAEERINELLDLWLMASSLGDEAWKAEIQERLSQLRAQYIT